MLGRTEKTFSIEIEVKCLVGQKNVQHRRKMLSRAEKTLSLEEKKYSRKTAWHSRKVPNREEKQLAEQQCAGIVLVGHRTRDPKYAMAM